MAYARTSPDRDDPLLAHDFNSGIIDEAFIDLRFQLWDLDGAFIDLQFQSYNYRAL